MSRIPDDPPKPMTLEQAVSVHLVGAVQFGKVIISYEHGKPVYVERVEGFRLTTPRDKT